MFRYRKTAKKYAGTKQNGCPFCEPLPENVIAEHSHSRIIRNIFAYDIWEYQDVTDHLMIVPKRHVRGLNELDEAEQLEIIRLQADYEAKGYNIYARSTDSIKRTIPAHQHTHLIKTGTKPARLAIYIKKPYWLLKI